MDIVEQLRKSANTIYSQDGYTFRLGLHNEAADEIERLREALNKYDCSCTEPCALYKMEKERESEMPHMVCGWWASAALKEGE